MATSNWPAFTSQSIMGTRRVYLCIPRGQGPKSIPMHRAGELQVPPAKEESVARQLEGRRDGEVLPSLSKVCVPIGEEKGKQVRFLGGQGLADKGICHQI